VNIYPRLEIFVTDYASRDATAEIAEKFGAKVVSLDKPGIGRARHECTLEARGEIMIHAPLGVDDYDFGAKAFKKIGERIFVYDKETIVFASDRSCKHDQLKYLTYLLKQSI